jgi:hypothetical protein
MRIYMSCKLYWTPSPKNRIRFQILNFTYKSWANLEKKIRKDERKPVRVLKISSRKYVSFIRHLVVHLQSSLTMSASIFSPRKILPTNLKAMPTEEARNQLRPENSWPSHRQHFQENFYYMFDNLWKVPPPPNKKSVPPPLLFTRTIDTISLIFFFISCK